MEINSKKKIRRWKTTKNVHLKCDGRDFKET